MDNISATLTSEIVKAFSEHATRKAINVDNESYTYAEVREMSNSIANVITQHRDIQGDYIAVLSHRSIHSYAGIFGVLLAGYAYMPLNPNLPATRLHRMMEISSCNAVILSEDCAEAFAELAEMTTNLLVICPDHGERIAQLRDSLSGHTFIFPENFPSDSSSARDVSPDDPAYLLFTSGSTGIPKGVVVSHKNVCSYLKYTIDRYQVSHDDRLSQMFDTTFDLSVHDIFVSLFSGACLCVVPKSSVMAPAKFIEDQRLTIWFSVPSVVMFLKNFRMLKPGSFATLRYSLFCGEAMPQGSAEAWQTAAPNSIIENLYGPTEATIAITNYLWNPQTSPSECVNGLLPIGWPFDEHTVKVVNEHGEQPEVGNQGELCLSGPQVTSGYLRNSEQTAERFVQFGDEERMWYRTGDLVKQDRNGCLIFLGRIDEQVQIRGYRAELQEIDQVLRQAAGTDLAICAPKLLEHGQAESVYAFIQGDESDFSSEDVLKHCQRNLPTYMVPTKIIFIDKMPVNANGKIIRRALSDGLSS